MRYCLGIDVGNSTVVAAVADNSGSETVKLGVRTPGIPSIAHVTPDGSVLTGDAAVLADTLEPARTARLLCRRLDDPAPIVLGERTWDPTDLLASVLGDVLAHVTAVRGGPPDHVVLVRPAVLGPVGTARFTDAVARAGRPDASTTTAPVACATWLIGNGLLRPGGRIAVYDFGGGTFEAGVMRRTTRGVDDVGPPNGIARLGGADLDELVRQHLESGPVGALGRWDLRVPPGARMINKALGACRSAKEALSSDGSAEVAWQLPGGTHRYVLRRQEIEALFRKPVNDTVEVFTGVLSAARTRPDELDAVALSGGSARIPLVTALLSQALGRGVRIAQTPDAAIAQGAARLATQRAAPQPSHRVAAGRSPAQRPGAGPPRIDAPQAGGHSAPPSKPVPPPRSTPAPSPPASPPRPAAQ
nr:Hsp70 family protein [Pseudonocardiales bacterium]